VVDPHRRARRQFVLWLLSFLGLFMVTAAFVLRPSPVLGVDDEALQHSVGGFLGDGHCEGLGDHTWRCSRREGGLFADEIVAYSVEVDNLDCWRADAFRFSAKGGPEHLSGCITVVDFISG
jgi:hypothetical protein